MEIIVIGALGLLALAIAFAPALKEVVGFMEHKTEYEAARDDPGGVSHSQS